MMHGVSVLLSESSVDYEWVVKNWQEHQINLSYKILGIALELHRNVGPGLLESAYENALEYDLREIGMDVKQQVPMPFIYKEIRLDVGYRIDLLIENSVIIEVKSLEGLGSGSFCPITYPI